MVQNDPTKEGSAETALVQVRPDADLRIIALYEEGQSLLRYAEARVIVSDSDIKLATDDLTIIAKVKKALEEKRKEYVGPINEHLKAVNAFFKTFVEPMERADVLTRGKIMDYRQEQERRRQEEERINQLRLEAAQAEMKLKGELTAPVTLVEVAPVAPTAYRTDQGTLGAVKVRKWELIDQGLLPEEYKIPDSARITKVVKAGIPAIPGIRIYEEESLRVTTR